MPTEKVDLTSAIRLFVEKLMKPLETRVEALEQLVKAQQAVIDKLNAQYRKPWSSSAGR
jgi:hypothetical protein